MQALILAGGEGTRLRPLTSTMPKPVVPLANQPFITFMIEWLRRHGAADVILSCGFLAEGVREVLGDGAALGVRIRYVEEPTPLGTGGALRYAGELLDERFLMLNGDVLCDFDLTAQIAEHERTGAQATLALYPVEDPSMYGLVRLAEDSAVTEFVEKPSPEEIDTDLINAGVYVLERSILDQMAPAGTNISIERDVFPKLVGRGLYGLRSEGYWLDIGTPERYLQGTFDILERNVETGAVRRMGTRVRVAPGAVLGPRVTLGDDVIVAEGAEIEDSVVLEATSIGAHTRIRGSIVGPRVRIGERCQLEGVVLGDGVELSAGSVLHAGARVDAGVRM